MFKRYFVCAPPLNLMFLFDTSDQEFPSSLDMNISELFNKLTKYSFLLDINMSPISGIPLEGTLFQSPCGYNSNVYKNRKINMPDAL